MSNLSVAKKPTPVGDLTLVASENGLKAILWPDDKPGRVRFGHPLTTDDSNPYLRKAAEQLDEYFAGSRRAFDIPLDLDGTAFQRAVWGALQEIPFGKTITYGELAEELGRPTAARAVGAAVGRNPVSVVIPCHRVVGRDGSLTGFAGGLDAKIRLLELEAPA